ncbi:ABC transporter ATP-binding protein [Candidatus Odyssella thessalonicensis]|uniref:ABC transporter ATP-binding protein n=1 Tax=Candidatus Odyssella thessalonicensis TaxID=84647 RepID=UPI000225B1A0|nr:ABC transporter transmembrane domain-containing protein [Candidatus Odyssella thessalonicensis]
MNKVLKKILSDGPTRQIATRLLREHVAPYRARFIIALMFMMVAAVANGAVPFILKYVFDDIFYKGNPELLFIVSASVFLAFSIRGAASYGEAVMMSMIGQRIICDLQNRLFSHLMRLDLSFFHRTSSGELISRFTNDIMLMRYSVSNVVVGLGKDFISLIVLITIMFYRDWMLASIAFILLPSVVLPISKVSRRMRKVTHNTQDEFGKITGQLSQIFQGMRVVKTYGMEPYEINRIETTNERIYNLIIKAGRIRAITSPIIEVLGGLTVTLIIAYGGWQVINGERTAGEFISFTGALLLCYDPLKRLGNLNSSLQEGLSAAQRVFNIIDTQPNIVDHPDAREIATLKGDLEFDGVYFSYPNGTQALKNVSLSAAAGQSIALVGASGSGKSTFINLIPRFYETTAGEIRVDGIALQNIMTASLRNHIAIVSQEVTLFDDTIYNNIAYGRSSATRSDIIEAAKAAAAHEFIEKLPHGYDTVVGENGVMLSGGQRQRIAIARAMLKNAPILLLDEATSALDTHSERQVQTALEALMKGKTTIIIAHRLSTIVNVDTIYVMDHGEIVEMGSHESLINKNGHYANLWRAQSAGDDRLL